MKAETLRSSILQWAIEGKLVPQLDTEPEVEQISEAPENIPFAIPEKWKWIELGKLVSYGKTTQVEPTQIENNAWILDLEDIESGTGILLQKKTNVARPRSKKNQFHARDVLYSKLRPNLNKVIVANDNGYCTTEVVPISLKTAQLPLAAEYLQIYLMSPFFVNYANQCSYGIKMPRLSTKDAKESLVPLPPLAEQQRIVARLNELLPLVAAYGQEQKTLEKIEKELPDKLRASLLQEAIQGKLVPQLDTEPEVEQIGDAPENIPFAIPEKWKWVYLENVCNYIQRGKSPKYSNIKQVPVISQKCNQWDGFHIEKAKFIDPLTIPSYNEERILKDNDLLWNSTGIGTLGRLAVYKENLNSYGIAVADSHVTVLRTNPYLIDYWFLYFYLRNPSVQSVIENQSEGSTKQKELSLTTIKRFLCPLPPLAEQRRIVARLNELLAEVDRLKA